MVATTTSKHSKRRIVHTDDNSGTTKTSRCKLMRLMSPSFAYLRCA